MKKLLTAILSAGVLLLPSIGVADDNSAYPLCSAADVQRNIDNIRASVNELQETHDTQRGMEMLHDHMALIIVTLMRS